MWNSEVENAVHWCTDISDYHFCTIAQFMYKAHGQRKKKLQLINSQYFTSDISSLDKFWPKDKQW